LGHILGQDVTVGGFTDPDGVSEQFGDDGDGHPGQEHPGREVVAKGVGPLSSDGGHFDRR
jgi:hypothetical protein